MKPILYIFLGILLSFSISAIADSDSFAPTWKLLRANDKQQFISGYTHGWQDAAKVIDVAISYVRSNPDQAIEGLQGLKAVYNLSGAKVPTLVDGIDAFYADPENQGAPLSAAITAAKKG